MDCSIVWRLIRLISVLLISSNTLAATAPEVQLHMEADSLDGTVTFTLHNRSDHDFQFLPWDTPFELELSDDILSIRPIGETNGVERRYVGRHPKRVAPTAEHLLRLNSGETIRQTIDLNRYYDIDQASDYSISFKGEIRWLPAVAWRTRTFATSLQHLEPKVAPVSMYLAPRPELRLRTPDYTSCSAADRSTIAEAAAAAETLAATAVNDLADLEADERPDSPRYVTWFGDYDEARYTRVSENFANILAALQSETLEFDCSCTESGVYAYVYPLSPYRIYLCSYFDVAPLLGTDSQAGTIIHELSHFQVVARTDDHVYTQAGARNLAQNDPARAIDNADNHEYFAENTPALAIRGGEGTAPVENASDNQNSTDESLASDGGVLLVDGDLISGEVASGELISYVMQGSGRIELDTLIGDADLFVAEDPSNVNILCISDVPGTERDVCEIQSNGTSYVTVYGFEFSEFQLEASSSVTDQTSEGADASAEVVEPMALAAGSHANGTLSAGEYDRFIVDDVTLLELVSDSGNADLYVFSDASLGIDSVVCTSIRFEQDIDRCELNAETELHVVVQADTDTIYRLSATAATTTTTDLTAVELGQLSPGMAVDGMLDNRYWHHYTLLDSTAVELRSDSGDVNLYLLNAPELDSANIVCESVELSAVNRLDQCTVPDQGRYHVAVVPVNAASYTLLARSAETDGGLEVTTASTPTEADDNSSGGGAIGALLMLLIVPLQRRRHLRSPI